MFTLSACGSARNCRGNRSAGIESIGERIAVQPVNPNVKSSAAPQNKRLIMAGFFSIWV
jgi:hypothetical protein